MRASHPECECDGREEAGGGTSKLQQPQLKARVQPHRSGRRGGDEHTGACNAPHVEAPRFDRPFAVQAARPDSTWAGYPRFGESDTSNRPPYLVATYAPLLPLASHFPENVSPIALSTDQAKDSSRTYERFTLRQMWELTRSDPQVGAHLPVSFSFVVFSPDRLRTCPLFVSTG
jgi:hypothetical protein